MCGRTRKADHEGLCTECDRSFTRSDALAKHMRTVHEPEPPRTSATNANPIDAATGQPKKGPKIRLTNGKGGAGSASKDTATDGAVFDLSHDNDNIVYLSAYHPITGQPGFMITYPPDIAFSQFESEIPADQLMRLLRRQLHWAQQESEELKAEIEMLEGIRREEWIKKDLLLDNVRDAELAVGKARGYVQDGLANDMERDIETAKGLKWSGEEPWWRKGDDGADEGGDADVEGEASRAGSAAYAGLPIGFDRARARNEDSMSEDEDGEDEELEQREDSADRRMDTTEDGGEQSARAERDDDMMAVGALMGLSAGKTDGG